MTNWQEKGFFKGFLRTKDKEAQDSFKSTTKNHLNLEQAKTFSEYAGLLSENAVLFDADDETNSNNLLNVVQGEKLACMVTTSGANLIAFRNGIFNLDTELLIPFSPDVVITNKINWDYNPQSYDELMDTTLNKFCCNDTEVRALIEEMIGACFYRSNTLGGGKAFVLTGDKSNGKSTMLHTLKALLGENNASNLDLKNLDDRFSTVMLFGKLANIGDDISDEYKSDVSTFKKIVTGDNIDAEQKGQPKFDFKPYVKLIFSANSIPKMRDSTGAAQRRLLIIPFNAKFTETDGDYDPQIVWKLQHQSSMEYLIQLGINGLKRVLQNRRFSSSEKVQKELEEYEKENNPVLAFVEEVGIDSIENERSIEK